MAMTGRGYDNSLGSILSGRQPGTTPAQRAQAMLSGAVAGTPGGGPGQPMAGTALAYRPQAAQAAPTATPAQQAQAMLSGTAQAVPGPPPAGLMQAAPGAMWSIPAGDGPIPEIPAGTPAAEAQQMIAQPTPAEGQTPTAAETAEAQRMAALLNKLLNNQRGAAYAGGPETWTPSAFDNPGAGVLDLSRRRESFQIPQWITDMYGEKSGGGGGGSHRRSGSGSGGSSGSAGKGGGSKYDETNVGDVARAMNADLHKAYGSETMPTLTAVVDKVAGTSSLNDDEKMYILDKFGLLQGGA